MNPKTFICSQASMAIPLEVSSTENNTLVTYAGKEKTVLNVINGKLTEKSKQTNAGTLVTQTLILDVTVNKESLYRFGATAILELTLSDIGRVIWGTTANPVSIKEIDNKMPAFKIKLERFSHIREF